MVKNNYGIDKRVYPSIVWGRSKQVVAESSARLLMGLVAKNPKSTMWESNLNSDDMCVLSKLQLTDDPT